MNARGTGPAVPGLLSDSDLLPPALAATLRAYREHLLHYCAAQPWVLPGNRARYAMLAQAIERQIAEQQSA